MAPSLTLWYFDIPGKAETTRLLLQQGGIPYQEKLISFQEWPEVKTKMPFGQLPVLEVDGKILAQSPAIERYCAKLAKLVPEDAWEAAKVDELVAFQQEIADLFMPSYMMKDAKAKVEARQEVVQGPLKARLTKLSELLEAAGGKFFTGDHVAYPDILTFKVLSGFISGAMDGVPTNLLDSYPVLKAFHDRVASLPAIHAYYKDVKEGPRLAYKPLSQ